MTEDKVWVSKPGGNDMEIVDSHTGKVDELALNYLSFRRTMKSRRKTASFPRAWA